MTSGQSCADKILEIAQSHARGHGILILLAVSQLPGQPQAKWQWLRFFLDRYAQAPDNANYYFLADLGLTLLYPQLDSKGKRSVYQWFLERLHLPVSPEVLCKWELYKNPLRWLQVLEKEAESGGLLEKSGLPQDPVYLPTVVNSAVEALTLPSEDEKLIIERYLLDLSLRGLVTRLIWNFLGEGEQIKRSRPISQPAVYEAFNQIAEADSGREKLAMMLQLIANPEMRDKTIQETRTQVLEVAHKGLTMASYAQCKQFFKELRQLVGLQPDAKTHAVWTPAQINRLKRRLNYPAQ